MDKYCYGQSKQRPKPEGRSLKAERHHYLNGSR
jgi:hypothetical protein